MRIKSELETALILQERYFSVNTKTYVINVFYSMIGEYSVSICYVITMKYIKELADISLADLPLIGGKTASLGQLHAMCTTLGIQVPYGFALTADAYWYFIAYNGLMPRLNDHMQQLTDYTDVHYVHAVSETIRLLFTSAQMPPDLVSEIAHAYETLCCMYATDNLSVAVRSSATAEDLPNASFAGQQESYLHMQGIDAVVEASKKCFASLFTARAIIYRHEKKFDYASIALSILIQKMVRADLGSAGVAFSLDTETGFKDVMVINASYGLGQSLVQGQVVPDEYVVFKKTLSASCVPIIKKECGSKQSKIVFAHSGITSVAVEPAQQIQFCLTQEQIHMIARAVYAIEQYYSIIKGSWCPVDVEWAYDGIDDQLYIVQARPETVHAQSTSLTLKQYNLKNSTPLQILAIGQSIGQYIVSGVARIVATISDCKYVQEGDIIITHMTDPDWMPLLKKARGIITQAGGRTCHAAIVSRELSIAALVGADNVMKKVSNGTPITLDCSQGNVGYVYQDTIPFDVQEVVLEQVPAVASKIMLNLADPARAFALASLPVAGVGLARMEFIINNAIKIHPMALLKPELVLDMMVQKQIDHITAAYSCKQEFFIDNLAYGIATIAAAFDPRPVIVRLSDFKTNEYHNLIGGSYFEKPEENPMIGFRGAVRYYSQSYKDAFALECAALKKVREKIGLMNITIMVPFVRTVKEAALIIDQLAQNGLKQGEHGLHIFMMCELPSNVVMIDEFLHYFDGISIGSNDLTQLTLGVDRDSSWLSMLFDERDMAVKKMIALAIAGAKRAGKYSGICGQAPSDYPELAESFIEQGIDSLSLNPDSVIPFLLRYKK